MDRELDNLNRLLFVVPPPELDALVRGRMQAAVAQGRREGIYPSMTRGAQSSMTRGAQSSMTRNERRAPGERAERPVAVPFAERCVYAAGLVLYGIQAASLVARVMWRSFSG